MLSPIVSNFGNLGYTFTEFYINSAGAVAFNASIATRHNLFDSAIFVSAPNGDLTYIIRYGDEVHLSDGRNLTISGYSIQLLDFNSNGEVLMLVPLSDGSQAILLAETNAAPLQVTAVSRKAHGAAGSYNISLPRSGTAGVECRSGGANNTYQLALTFQSPASFTGAGVTSGSGMVVNASGSGTDSATIDLADITNAQTLNVTLFNVDDGNSGPTDLVVPMSVLVGDVNGNGTVNATDISQVKLQSGHAIDSSNFRNDVTASGTINGSDVSLVKSKSGTGLD
jgi:Dockerin type I domain